jgi:hypothetical protein
MMAFKDFLTFQNIVGSNIDLVLKKKFYYSISTWRSIRSVPPSGISSNSPQAGHSSGFLPDVTSI